MVKGENNRIVPDTSVIIDGFLSEMVESGKYEGIELFISEAMVAELESQANRGLDIGNKGLDELKQLQEMAREGMLDMSFTGKIPTAEERMYAKAGTIDAIIRSCAEDLDATFVTGDKVQYDVAVAKGMDVEYLPPRKNELMPLLIEDFFTDDTMSVHLKHKIAPMAKRGSIKNIEFVTIRDTPCSSHELKQIIRELLERARADDESFTEMSLKGATVLQIRDMRIAISTPPFSDDVEITAVRPVASVSLDDYYLGDELKERILAQRGILVSGPPGAGKSTFGAGVAIFLHENNYVVKTMESPRDLQVPNEITQYAPLEGSMEKTADVLLLVRPDYTIYDEVRKTRDFEIFADMRLAGVGMIGVVHANRAIDAVQRLIGRVELGVIPQVVDTVIFIDKGEVAQVQTLEFTVKVPSGMLEADLARPVIVVSDFETSAPEFEIYTFGEQVVVMPVSDSGSVARKPVWGLAEGEIEDVVQRYAKGPVDVEMLSDTSAVVKVLGSEISKVIGKSGVTIDEIEKIVGVHIDVRELDEKSLNRDNKDRSPELSYRPTIEHTKKHVILNVPEIASQDVEIYAGDDYLFTATVGRHGDVKVRSNSALAGDIMDAVDDGNSIIIKVIQ
ncbi:PINc/VapC family ATPase [Methanococcoides burtonii]|uniref:Protein with nucleotide-binding PIN domain and RNA-binding KH domain n=1 Tax=Methanococcoides burtonii (strain DSM 6242 / NBRC 107633 / OCM 468 / ACE-M) TaxID=259564 RepID=Q12V47_METBU|nr:PINc/VapC family ATPase [Methanococcoides burtonii]ABE52679.1 protein with nucleotide-binding PIN domain and RNA-binding KH domain [Methanococcoides burtonii DSM 6242]